MAGSVHAAARTIPKAIFVNFIFHSFLFLRRDSFDHACSDHITVYYLLLLSLLLKNP